MTHLKMAVWALLLITLVACGGGEDDTLPESPDTPETPEIPDTQGTEILTLSLQGTDGRHYQSFLTDDSCMQVVVAPDADLTRLSLTLTHNGETALLDDTPLGTAPLTIDCSDFTHPHRLTIVSSLGQSQTRSLVVHDLPVVLIDTPDGRPITSKEERTQGCRMQLVDTDGQLTDLGTAGIRGRGGSTWEQPKKPYNIKLDQKQGLLGMNKSKHWILLANCYYDRTQLHNATAYEMARLTDYPWVQEGRFVELIFNGRHQGLYYLCEKIRIEKDKINITEMTPDDLSGEALTGGYLLETMVVPGYYDDYPFLTRYFNKTGYEFGWSLAWEVKSPEGGRDLPPAQLNYIQESMNEMERLIYDDELLMTGAYRNLFDIETAINWWLVEEAAVNDEASLTKNVYLYKDRGGRFCVGPPWDFDAWTFGQAGDEEFNCNEYALYYRQLLKDPVFVAHMKEKWAVYRQLWAERIPAFIDTTHARIRRSALRNEQMWPDWIWVNRYPDTPYDEYVAEMKATLLHQLEWMDAQIAGM